MFRLNPNLDPDRLAAAFRVRRRLHIPEFLVAEDADRLYESLLNDPGWRVVIKQGLDRHEFDPGQLTLQQKDQLSLLARRANPDALQFRFDYIQVPDSARQRAENRTLLNQFAAFIGSEPTLSLFRKIIGVDSIAFADAQGTAYGTGDFLTLHDDGIVKQNRHAAYVLNLTPKWKMDWGGLLMFPGPDGHVAEAFTPMYNALNIFAVPQPHSVSEVARFADSKRYAISGWLRSGEQPE